MRLKSSWFFQIYSKNILCANIFYASFNILKLILNVKFLHDSSYDLTIISHCSRHKIVYSLKHWPRSYPDRVNTRFCEQKIMKRTCIVYMLIFCELESLGDSPLTVHRRSRYDCICFILLDMSNFFLIYQVKHALYYIIMVKKYVN